MATVTKSKPFNHEETQRRVRSPLQQVRKVIRRYIFLEGLALVLLAAALLFWLGLAFDFGLFKFDFDALNVHGIDWVLALNDVDASGFSSLACRVIFLSAAVIGLLAFGFYKVALRWFREFNDRAVALVLERRFHKELGDRLITAIELADPKLSKKYGYSQAMVEKTISEAVQILKKLPIAAVFNWRRLYVLWILVGVATVGLLLVNMAAFCAGSLFTKEPMNPYVFSWKFYDTASIWTERNVLMMKTYWPRRAHLEIGRFQPSALDPNDMRVPMPSDERPALTVRAYEWVIADRDEKKAPYGWRPLTWHDLADHHLVDAQVVEQVRIPGNFKHWQVDPEELEPNLTAALFGTDTHVRTSSETRAYLDELHAAKHQANDLSLPWERRRAIKAANEPANQAQLAKWLDWTEWTVDKLKQQKDDADNVRPLLRDLVNNQDHFEAMEAVFNQLEETAAAPSMGRTVRKLALPKEIHVRFVGAEKTFAEPLKPKDGYKYEVSLASLGDSPMFRFRARAENYFTPPKTITLVASPSPASISIDKDEPAYIYHRLHELDQSPLKGVRYRTRELNLPTTGDTNTIEVPLGSNLTIHVLVDATPLDWGGLHLYKLTAAQQAKAGLPKGEGLLVMGVDAGFAEDKFPNAKITVADVKAAGQVTVTTRVKDLAEGDRVTIQGSSLGVANGTWKISAVEGNTFTFANPAATELSATGKGGEWLKGGFAVDDILLTINQKAVPNDLDAFAKLVSELDPKAAVDFVVQRRHLKETFREETAGVSMPASAHYQPRRLRTERATDFSKQQIIDPGFAPYQGQPPVVDADRRGFSLSMTNLARKHDFTVEFFDEDNIRGKRRFKILSVIDMEPQLGNLNIGGLEIRKFNMPYQGVLLRKPKFKAPAPLDKEKDKDGPQRDYKEQAELASAYLITPDALLPFECSVKDDYGLTSIGYNFKIRKADVELMSQGGGAKVPVAQVDQVSRRANAALVASNFQFVLGNPLALNPASVFGGQYHLAFTVAVLREDLRRTQGYREAYVSCDGFNNLLERKFDKMIYIDTLKKALKDPKERARLLTGPRSSQPWEFDFKEDDGFDVKKHLPELKAVDVEKTGQQHYFLQIAVQAVDNNVETGSFRDAEGRVQGNKRTNRNGYIGFLVISENELLTQISLEEEAIAEKLEGAKEKVDAGIISLKDQLGRVADPKTDMDNVLNRMNEIRTALASAGNILRDAHKSYENILREMEVNRVRSDRMTKIADRIALPLKDIVVQHPLDDKKNPDTGSFPYAEEAFQNAHQLVEDDVNAKREPNYAAHREAMSEADRKLRKLSLDIKRVLDAMSEGIVESKLIAIIAGLERAQVEKTRLFEKIEAKLIDDALRDLLKEPEKKSPMPKKEEKKSSQLRSGPGGSSGGAQRAGRVSDGFSSVANASGSYRQQDRKEHPAVLFAVPVLDCAWSRSRLRQSTA